LEYKTKKEESFLGDRVCVVVGGGGGGVGVNPVYRENEEKKNERKLMSVKGCESARINACSLKRIVLLVFSEGGVLKNKKGKREGVKK
jgi:hypothetical protein